MKGFGKKILTAVVALLLLAAPVAIVWGITSQMNNKESNVISMTEARALVNQVYTAVSNPGGNSNQLSTTATESYDHNYVDLHDNNGNAVYLLSIVKCALEVSEKDEDYFKSELNLDSGEIKESLGYKLCKNGVIFRLLNINSSGVYTITVELYRGDDNNWELVIDYTDPEHTNNSGKYEIRRIILRGHDYITMYYQNKCIVYENLLKEENITLAFFEYIDAEKHVCESNAFGDTTGWKFMASTVGELTNAQITNLIVDGQNILNNYWYVDFAEKELRNSDYLGKAYAIFDAYMESVS